MQPLSEIIYSNKKTIIEALFLLKLSTFSILINNYSSENGFSRS